MTPFIIAAISADGFIGKDSHHPAYWSSREDKKRFVELTKRAGVIVMGSNTWKTLPRPLAERKNIVYSRTQKFEGAETTTESPRDLIARLETEGYKEVAICGGAEIYNMFLKEKVVRKIYLTVEPIIFGKGVSLFKDEYNIHLELKNSTVSESGAVMVEYDVKYS